MDLIAVSLILVTVIICYWYFNQDKQWKQLSRIPGPRIWPIIGNLHIFDQSPAWKKTYHMAKKYGPVMRLQIGSVPVVILNSYEAIYESLVTKAKQLLTRPMLSRAGHAVPEYKGVIFSESSEQWKTLRRAFLLNFKFYGSGKSHLEPIILDVLEDFLQEIKATNQKSVNPRPMIYRYFGGIMYVLNFGGKTNSAEYFKLIETFDQELIQFLNPFGGGLEYDIFPWYRKLQKFGFGKNVLQSLKKIAGNTTKIWEKYGRTAPINPDHAAFSYEEGRIREPFFAATLRGIVAENKEHGFDDFHAQGTIGDTFTGGLVTSTMTIHFFFNILLHYPEIQEKLQEEVDKILGDNYEALITTDLKGDMPYHQATLYELLRYTSILPFGLPRFTEEDVIIQEHFIPKGVVVLHNTWFLHHNDYWDEPFEFKPERFLDEDGAFVTADHPNRKHWMPFSAGLRVCAGMVLALNRYFITIGNIMRHFSVVPDPDGELQSCDPRQGKPGLFIHGKAYTARFIPRGNPPG